MENKKKIFWSKTSIMHAIKLAIRSAFFLTALIVYIIDKTDGSFDFFSNEKLSTIVIIVVFGIYLIEMLLRFFPNDIESMGCQKIFKKNYIKPINEKEPYDYPKLKGVILTLIIWLALNGIFGTLYWTHIVDEGILILISLLYGICDMICILFFCPFQTWFMKNKCCNTCRIYNWDFGMMFTPLLFIPHWATLTLGAVGIALALTWEITYLCHKERFYEISNDSLKCANCKEKLCFHKTQLSKFVKHLRQELENSKINKNEIKK